MMVHSVIAIDQCGVACQHQLGAAISHRPFMGANGLDRERRVKEACRGPSARNQVEINTNAEPELGLAA